MIYLAVVVTAALLTFFIKKAAIKKAIWDIPNHRSSHTTPVPRGGGLAIVIAFYAGLLFLPDVEKHLLYALLCALPIALTGFLDDLLDLSSRTRLAVQFVSAAAALYFLQLPFVPALFGLFLIVWFTNLFNFLDGIDGYVTTEAIFIGIAGYLFTGDGVLLLLSAAAAGFLPFNWQKASIFMGDVGSTFIGFVVAVLLLYHTRTFHEGLIWLLLTAPFWFDATYTLLRRLINGEKITQAHRKHLFQRAVIGGLSHRSVTLILLGIDLLIASLLLLFPEHLPVVTVVAGLLLVWLTYYIEQRVSF